MELRTIRLIKRLKAENILLENVLIFIYIFWCNISTDVSECRVPYWHNSTKRLSNQESIEFYTWLESPRRQKFNNIRNPYIVLTYLCLIISHISPLCFLSQSLQFGQISGRCASRFLQEVCSVGKHGTNWSRLPVSHCSFFVLFHLNISLNRSAII